MTGWLLATAAVSALIAWYAGSALSARRAGQDARRLQDIVGVVGECLAMRDDAELAHSCAWRLAAVLGADAVTIRVVRGLGLERLGSHGEAGWGSEQRLPLGSGAPGWVWATGKPSVVDDLLKHPTASPQQMPVRSGLYLPGHVDDQVVVVLAVESRRAAAFGADDLRLLLPVATLLATALRSRQLLRDAERFEDRLLTLVGHEMRTPLTAVIGTFTTLINKGDRLNEELRHRLETLGLRSGRRLERVVQTMLMAAQLERDLISFDTTAVALADVVGDAVRLSAADAAVAVDVQPELYVVATPHHLTTALQHLLDNAVLHGAAPVRINAVVNGPQIKIEVRDQGPGIPEDALEEVFGRFRRHDDTILTRPGSGLGLYITRRLVEGMGGELEIWSEPGHGCRASIRVPLYVPADGEVDLQPRVVEGITAPAQH